MTITTEELQRLLSTVTQGDWDAVVAGQDDDLNEVVVMKPFQSVADAEGDNARLIALAPYLARRVLAAEKMAASLDWVASNARFARRENIRSVAQEAIEKYEATK